jgi:general nucleoside transport system permease protein
MRARRVALAVAAPLLAFAISLVVSALVLEAAGYSSGDAFSAMIERGGRSITVFRVLNATGPYYLAGVAVAIGFKMNIFNIGVEGQYRLAALLTGAWAGSQVAGHLPAPLHVLSSLVVAVVVGAAWAGIAGVLKAYRGVSEVISTIMLNAIAVALSAYLLVTYLRAPRRNANDLTIGTREIPGSGRFPLLNRPLEALGVEIPQAGRLSSYLLLAILTGVAYYVLVWRSRFGYDLRATGLNADAARASGIDPKRMILTTMLLSGGVAGLVGLSSMMTEAGRYTSDVVVGGLGFTGIAVALLGRNNPVGIAIAAVLFAYLDQASLALNFEDIPKEIVAIMQGVIVLAVVIAYEIVRRAKLRIEAHDLASDQPEPSLTPAGAAQ